MVYLQNCKAVYSATRDSRLSRFYPPRERDGFSLHNDNVSSFEYGLGTGVEYDLRDLDARFIPLFVSAELNLHFFDNSRDDYYYDSKELGLGFGLHYKF